jgi:predicted enzyme related to lactoylglutathione lyase
MGPHQVPGDQWIVQCTDPQGAYFALVSLKK